MQGKWVYLLIVISFLALTAAGLIFNFTLLSEPIFHFFSHPASFSKLSQDVSAAIKSENLVFRDELININGLYARVTGRNLYNEVLRMKNGMLNYSDTVLNPKSLLLTEEVSDFKSYIEEKGGKFIYVQFPGKYDSNNLLIPDGINMQIPKEINGLMDQFQRAGIDIINEQPLFTETQADLERYFYRTDHHWKPTAAFRGTRILMEHLQTLFPEENYMTDVMDLQNWSIHEIPEQFLGSRGRRVGVYYAGLDPLEWMTPDFPTNVSFYYPQDRLFLKGNYEKAFIREQYLEPGGNKLETDYYNVYLGNNYPYVQTRNSTPASDQKVLLIHDSFGLPVISFLSLIFREVDSIDPRSYEGLSIKEFTDQMRPDIVIMAMAAYPDVINDEKFFTFTNGRDEFLSEEKILLTETSVKIMAETDHKIACSSFENGKYYTISFPIIETAGSPADSVLFELYDPASDSVISRTIADTEYCSKYGDCQWTIKTPRTGSEKLQLIISGNNSDGQDNPNITIPNLQIFERTIL